MEQNECVYIFHLHQQKQCYDRECIRFSLQTYIHEQKTKQKPINKINVILKYTNKINHYYQNNVTV